MPNPPKSDPASKPIRSERGQRTYSAEQVQTHLKSAPGWEVIGGNSITRTYKLPSFRSALSFVAHVGELAEAQDHHPDIDIRYCKVTLKLSTHSAGGLTEKDFELVGAIDG